MSRSRFAVLDPAAGISGDMLLGALIAAGAPREWLAELPARLGLAGVTVGIAEVDRCSVRAVKVTVRAPDGEVEGPGDLEAHQHRHGQGGGHQEAHHGVPHRHLAELLRVVEEAPISPWVRERALAAFRLLGEAEGRVHGVGAERVALHEVGAVDALVDIIGAIEGFERLGITEVYHRPVALGSGWVRAAHGTLPVPAPATAILLEGMAVAGNGPVRGEATTPTGAALLRVLSSGAPPSYWRAVASGWGAGTRDPAEYPNALRLILAEGAPEAAEVVLLATDVDDLSPEYLEPLREALTAAGALDVQTWATQMKKGRVGFRIEVVAPLEAEEAVVEALFAHSTTAGVRRQSATRRTLDRRHVSVTAAGEPIRVKVLDGPTGRRVKPEYDDVQAAARRSGRPALEVAAEAGELARRLEPLPGASSAHKESS